jgi:hypothetical protein
MLSMWLRDQVTSFAIYALHRVARSGRISQPDQARLPVERHHLSKSSVLQK